MSKTDPNEPAFPRIHRYASQNGITIRDYFAAKAMQALVGSVYESDSQLEVRNEVQLAEQAYAFADAMLVAREPKEPA